jgi:hypothetical protein
MDTVIVVSSFQGTQQSICLPHLTSIWKQIQFPKRCAFIPNDGESPETQVSQMRVLHSHRLERLGNGSYQSLRFSPQNGR